MATEGSKPAWDMERSVRPRYEKKKIRSFEIKPNYQWPLCQFGRLKKNTNTSESWYLTLVTVYGMDSYINNFCIILGTVLISVFMIQWRLNHEGLDSLGLRYAPKR